MSRRVGYTTSFGRSEARLTPLYPNRRPGRWRHRLLAAAAIAVITLNLVAIAAVIHG